MGPIPLPIGAVVAFVIPRVGDSAVGGDVEVLLVCCTVVSILPNWVGAVPVAGEAAVSARPRS